MAIRPEDEYGTRAVPSSPDYPHGSAKNETAPGANDGTPYTADFRNDVWGFFQAAMALASVTPSGNPETAQESQILASLRQGIGNPTGAVQHYAGSTAPFGWLARNGDTIGPAGSGADHSGAEYEGLYLLLWNEFADGDCPVTGGRGASASADWAADKPLGLMDDRGLVDRGFDGTGTVDPDRGPGDFGTYQADQNATHDHGGATAIDGDHNHGFPVSTNTGGANTLLARLDDTAEATQVTNNAGEHSHTIPPDGGAEARMKNRAYLPIIKV